MLILEGEVCEICKGARCRECGGTGTLLGYLDTQDELQHRTNAELSHGPALDAIDQALEHVRSIALGRDEYEDLVQRAGEAAGLIARARGLVELELGPVPVVEVHEHEEGD